MVSFELTRQGNIVIAHIAGEMVGSGARAFGEAVAAHFGQVRMNVVLDLGAVDRIDDEGLRELMLALKRVRRAGGNLCLAQPQDALRDALAASRLDEIIAIQDSLADAIERF